MDSNPQLITEELQSLFPPEQRICGTLPLGSLILMAVKAENMESFCLLVKKVDSSYIIQAVFPITGSTTFSFSETTFKLGEFTISVDGMSSGVITGFCAILEALRSEALSKSLDPTPWVSAVFKTRTALGESPNGPPSLLYTSNHSSDLDKKQLYIQTQLRLREEEFMNFYDIKVLIASWNVNGKSPKDSIIPWVTTEGVIPDIIACGLQEFDTSTSALFVSETAKAETWITTIELTINRFSDVQYVMLGKQQLGGTLEMVWIKKELFGYVRDVQIQYTSTGIGNVLANKGATAIRLDLFNSSFCFVNSHLAAHDENVERRNLDFASIVSETRFADNKSVWDHQFLFWFGDLNYRISLPRSRILSLIKDENWSELLANDQLNEQRKLGTAFAEFTEGKIDFAPTYRFDNGTNTYDTSEKQRKPSYTDRVLHRVSCAADLKLVNYSSVPSLMTSDHKPINALYSVKVREVRPRDYTKVYASVTRNMENVDNMYPEGSLNSSLLSFGDIRYGCLSTQEVELKNTGQILFRWKFIPKPDKRVICNEWTTVEPTNGALMPNETVKIKISILIEGRNIPSEFATKNKIDDILVLQVLQGKDYFINIDGNYLRSSFGVLLDHLVRIPQPIRVASTLLKEEESLKVPKEIWTLVDFIFRHGMNEPDIFLNRGIAAEMNEIRECVDTGTAINPKLSPHSVAETLLMFLDALPQPVVPIVYYGQAIEPNASHAFCKQILEAMPETNYNVFYYIISLGRELVNPSKYKNQVTSDELALVLGRVLLRPPNEAKYKKSNVVEQHEVLKKRFVFRFLVESSEVKAK